MSKRIVDEDSIFDLECEGKCDECDGSCSNDCCAPAEQGMELVPRVVPVGDGFGLLVPVLISDMIAEMRVVSVVEDDGKAHDVEVSYLLLPPALLIDALSIMQQAAAMKQMESPVVPVEHPKKLWTPGDGDPGIVQ
jgi:hypothetical protein